MQVQTQIRCRFTCGSDADSRAGQMPADASVRLYAIPIRNPMPPTYTCPYTCIHEWAGPGDKKRPLWGGLRCEEKRSNPTRNLTEVNNMKYAVEKRFPGWSEANWLGPPLEPQISCLLASGNLFSQTMKPLWQVWMRVSTDFFGFLTVFLRFCKSLIPLKKKSAKKVKKRVDFCKKPCIMYS